MLRIDKAFNIIGLALIILACSLAIAQAQTPSSTSVQWLWPSQSVAAAQSTTAMVQGQIGRARAAAERARLSARGFDEVVALHNLCLLDLGRGEYSANCDEALRAASKLPVIIQGRSLPEIVAANIAHVVRQDRAQTANLVLN